jgi:hypothetical protein
MAQHVRQQTLPSAYRGKGLWRGCRWAVNMSPWRGREQNGPYCVCESNTRNMGRFSGTVVGSMTVVRQDGLAKTSNEGQSGFVWVDYVKVQVPQEGVYSWMNTGGMTLACLMQFCVELPNSNRRILTKRFGTASNYHGGALSVTSNNFFEYSYCDGSTTQSIISTVACKLDTPYVIVGKHWGNNVLTRAELWVNGQLLASNAAPSTYPYYHSDPPITFFNDTGSGDAILKGKAHMGGLWNRPISASEIQQLTANPYVMWMPRTGTQGLPHGVTPGAIAVKCGCCGFLRHWYGMG